MNRIALFIFLFFIAIPGVHAAAIDTTTKNHVKSVAQSCLNHKWETSECLRAVSNSNFEMAVAYGTALQDAGKESAAEKIKQHCAASTAARERSFPASAMQSAFTECANIITDVADSANMTPDLNLYQLLVGAVLCLGDDPRCTVVTKGLKRFK